MVEEAHGCRVAGERLRGERVDLQQRKHRDDGSGAAAAVARDYSMMTRTSPVPTVSPVVTRISLTVPDLSALMWFSIFIASSTTRAWPLSTVSPIATITFTIVPCMGAVTLPPSAFPADEERAAARGRARTAATGAAAVSSTQTLTSKRFPSTS